VSAGETAERSLLSSGASQRPQVDLRSALP